MSTHHSITRVHIWREVSRLLKRDWIYSGDQPRQFELKFNILKTKCVSINRKWHVRDYTNKMSPKRGIYTPILRGWSLGKSSSYAHSFTCSYSYEGQGRTQGRKKQGKNERKINDDRTSKWKTLRRHRNKVWKLSHLCLSTFQINLLPSSSG